MADYNGGIASALNTALNKIRKAIYGKDVRQAIYDAIVYCNTRIQDNYSNLSGRIDSVNSRVDNVISQVGDEKKDTELIDIRNAEDGVIYKTAGEAIRTQFSIQKLLHEEQDEKIKKVNENIDSVKYTTSIVESTYLQTYTAWDTTRVEIGDFVPELEPIPASGCFVYKKEVKKGDVFELTGEWYLEKTAYSEEILITNGSHVVIDKVSFDDLNDTKKYTFAENGYFYMTSTTPDGGSGVEMFKIKSLNNFNGNNQNSESLDELREEFQSSIKSSIKEAVYSAWGAGY